MDLNKLPIFSLVNRRMAWLAKRQEILAQNIANADTPNYRPRDLKPLSFAKVLQAQRPNLGMLITRKGHIAPASGSGGFRAESSRDVAETAPAGNAVILEDQLMKVNETQNAYRLATNLYRKHLRMIKTALGQR